MTRKKPKQQANKDQQTSQAKSSKKQSGKRQQANSQARPEQRDSGRGFKSHRAGRDARRQRDGGRLQPDRLQQSMVELDPQAQQVLVVLAAAEQALTTRQCAEQLEAATDLPQLLEGLQQEQLVIQPTADQWLINPSLHLASGAVSAHADGYGFVLTPAAHEDVYLDEQQMATVMHGDTVLVQTRSATSRNKVYGELLAVVERARKFLVGRVVESGSGLVLAPDNPRITGRLELLEQAAVKITPGVIVVAEIVSYPQPEKAGIVRVMRELDDSNEAGLATEIAIIQHALPERFSAACLQQAQSFGEQIDPDKLQHREDLRELPLVTIDGADARDFDDAVYCHATPNGWRLLVAIADVASYVLPGTALDDDAWERGTSVYFPTRVIPMLPEALSNGLCSLRPHEQRLALVCDMQLDNQGKLQQSRHYKAVMSSHARLTYGQAQAIIDGDMQAPAPAVLSNLLALHSVFELQSKLREQRGALAFDRPESMFLWNADGSIASIEKTSRMNSHKLIEESMILANVATARFLQRRQQPALYRVHAPPQGRKLEELQQLLLARGIKPTWREQPEPRDFAQLQAQCADREDAHIIDEALLRAQSLAVYLPENEGHFGLALDAYSHFTSPIRRYPDLVVHRALHALIDQQPASSYIPGDDVAARLDDMAAHCSMTERRAEEAARDVEWRLICDYMQDFIGTQFKATVTGIKPFGMFVELHDPVVSGLVHISQMGKDYYLYDERTLQLRNRRSGQSFSISDRLTVTLVDVDIDQRKLNFALTGPA